MKTGINVYMKVALSMRIFLLVLPGDLMVMFFYVGRVDKYCVIDTQTVLH